MFAKILRQQFAEILKGGLTTAADDVDFKLKTAANKGWFKRPGHSKAQEVVILRLLAGPNRSNLLVKVLSNIGFVDVGDRFP